MRERVLLIEQAMHKLASEAGVRSDAAQIPVHHFHWGGIYMRQITIPADTLLTGEIHKYDNLNLLLKGDISVLIGEEIQRLVAPMIIPSGSGVKRIAYTHAETIWITLLPTLERDPAVIERLFIAKSEADYQQFLALAHAEVPQCLS